ncbi:hypothetical protein K438DRAFT_1901061 [Mycena galopus ATCC 62051]|nr:hypothetical protein K438DRAFT_1901061 [Mycena galopus ATCC 62051]
MYAYYVKDATSCSWADFTQPPYPLLPCPGYRVDWDIDNFWDTYPFQKHGCRSKHCVNYDFISFHPTTIRSNSCLGEAPNVDMPCSRCCGSATEINILKERASRPFDKLHAEEDLNNMQLREKLSAAKEDINQLKLKNLNITDSLNTAQEHLADFTDVYRLIGENQVPALHRIFANASREGWGINKLRKQIQLAIEGKYKARNYTEYEIDLVILLYELGGAGTVHAMNHSIFVLPSLRTIQPHRRLHKISPSVNGLKFSEISKNISTLFGSQVEFDDGTKTTESPPTLCGHMLSFNELAIDRRIDYMTETDEMGGFCVEHVNTLDTIKVGKGIQNGKVHIAHEASVGAISRLFRTNYGARPVFIAPTCKKGSWKDMLRTMLTVIEAWKRSRDGEKKHGPVLAVTSDGDPKRHLALFVMCMHDEIRPGNPLYPYICKLLGFNCRLCTSLCSPEGIAVKNVCINRDLLLHWLEKLPNNDWSETSIHTLLNPADPQSVERALKLMLSIVALRKLDSDDFDPSEAAEFEALCLLGEVFDYLLQPFINADLSLSEQITWLITFSHLICALYRQNGQAFLSNQLYGDLQAMVKNTILMVLKTRIIDGRLGVYICLLGDDVLESLFGRARMIGGHSPNCSIGELQDRFGSAINLDFVYDKHLELERKPRRLKLLRTQDLDHLRPECWGGEVSADSCDLELCWSTGVAAAEGILQKYGIKITVSFAELFQRPNTDLMRPNGGKYPAISPGVDRSMANLSANPTEIPDDVDPNTVNPNNPLLYINFDEMIAREEAESSDATLHSLFAEINAEGHLTHKKSILRILFDMTPDARTSHDRLQRVRGFGVSVSTHFQLGNMFTTLMCYNSTHLGLAVAKCTLIKKCIPGTKPVSISAVLLAELNPESSPYIISGQVFSLVPVDAVGSEWAWDGQFVSFSCKKGSKSSPDNAARIPNLQFAVSSRIIDPIHQHALERLASEIQVSCEREKTWVFSNQHILDSWNRLWTSVLADNSLHDKFATKFTGVSSGIFPYTLPGSVARPGFLYALPIAGTAIQITSTDRRKCRVCNKQVKDTDRQMHVGQHILKSLLGVTEPDIILLVSSDSPCGTCGGPSTGEACYIQIKSGKADSNCSSAYPFQIAAASKFSDKWPCTNVPIRCSLGCNEIHYKYNFPQHLEKRHPSWRKLISASSLAQIQVTRGEQRALGVPDSKIIDWLPASPPFIPIGLPAPEQARGQKRTADCLQRSPSR